MAHAARIATESTCWCTLNSTVEQYYFQRWWTTDATPSDQAAIQQFVAEGRFEFAVGGWVMPDEAVTDYADLIETMTIGHEFIWNTFGVVPKYGFQVWQCMAMGCSMAWRHSRLRLQCDPFGASSVFAAQSALMGFDAHIIDRINYWEKSEMQQAQTLEFMWEPSVGPRIAWSDIFSAHTCACSASAGLTVTAHVRIHACA